MSLGLYFAVWSCPFADAGRGVTNLYWRQWVRHQLSGEEAQSLIWPVQNEEINDTVFNIAKDKSPRQDGYSEGFKVACPVVGKEVTTAILDFFNKGRLLNQVNATLLAYISKVQMPIVVADYRPIACRNVLYKIITKIMIQRLKELLVKVVHPDQMNLFLSVGSPTSSS
ncbi:hypothetical protein Sango_2667100 [Sesamum angolense]|uniref:Reverse transcriptase n=1 Tax=Sesamum angolense TaxID=2727404 RepID=A0AAE2BHE6_9LAMI|nr:hypothetical protein Sango_2667100 [Sesamum angolense]